jgi:hypothetical protein
MNALRNNSKTSNVILIGKKRKSKKTRKKRELREREYNER